MDHYSIGFDGEVGDVIDDAVFEVVDSVAADDDVVINARVLDLSKLSKSPAILLMVFFAAIAAAISSTISLDIARRMVGIAIPSH
jgi:hypothetical protein